MLQHRTQRCWHCIAEPQLFPLLGCWGPAVRSTSPAACAACPSPGAAALLLPHQAAKTSAAALQQTCSHARQREGVEGRTRPLVQPVFKRKAREKRERSSRSSKCSREGIQRGSQASLTMETAGEHVEAASFSSFATSTSPQLFRDSFLLRACLPACPGLNTTGLGPGDASPRRAGWSG